MNYYDVLGVARNADPAVIRAAYKVLVQKYHPDKYSGSDAAEKITAINLAFETLSDSSLRKAYDETLDAQPSEEAEYANDESGDFIYSESDWDYACKYINNIKALDQQLASIAPGLSGFFRALILETKDFNNAQKIAKDIEQNYLAKYFGSNPKIVGFARELLLGKRLDAAKELNKVVIRLGSAIDPTTVISRINNDFPYMHPFTARAAPSNDFSGVHKSPARVAPPTDKAVIQAWGIVFAIIGSSILLAFIISNAA